ncbi:MAG: DUF4055 domain-containing protein [Longimicrobiales bacterium]
MKDQPNATGVAHDAQAEAVEYCRDVYGGTLAVRNKRTKYLPMFPMETPAGYAARLAGAVLFNGMRRTVKGLSGMVFRKDPTLSDEVPELVQEHSENIDQAGRSLPVFAKDCFDNQLIDGQTHIFVDMPQVDAGRVRTLEDERNARLRPYWINILKMQVLRFRTRNENGRPVLVNFAYHECTTEEDGTYGEKEVERVRIYNLVDGPDGKRSVQYHVWKRDKKAAASGEWQPEVTGGTMSISRIPLTTAYSDRTGFMTSNPPLLDLAIENIGHYQVRSDRRNSLHIAGVPIPIFTGLDDDDKITVSVEKGIRLPVGGDAKYLEPTGAALEQMREELRDTEQRMAALGLAMLQRDTRAAETAEARRIDASESQSSLSTAARSHEGALNEALSFHAEWLDQGADAGGKCEVNRDFEDQTMAPEMITALSNMVAQGQLSVDTLWDRMQKGEILPDDFDTENEKKLIAEQGMREIKAALDAGARKPAPAPAA